MKTIWKFKLEITDEQCIPMPKDANILYVGSQGNDTCIWAEVDPGNDKELRVFHIYGTGHLHSNTVPMKYLGTAQGAYGMIWHVYEIKQEKEDE